jgi:hypothetical protein
MNLFRGKVTGRSESADVTRIRVLPNLIRNPFPEMGNGQVDNEREVVVENDSVVAEFANDWIGGGSFFRRALLAINVVDV